MNQTGELLDTKERILEAAERLFAEEGIEAASLRSITSAAGVNLAAVNYHFHSKLALAQAVLARRLGPVNQARLELLDAYLQEAGDGPLSPERVLETFLAPAMRLKRDLGQGGANFMKLMGRLHGEPAEVMQKMLTEQFASIIWRYQSALKRSLPGITDTELTWGMHFTIGAMAHTMTRAGLLDVLARTGGRDLETETLMRKLVDYAAAGLRSQIGAAKTRDEDK